MKIFLSAAFLVGGILVANASQAVITAGPGDLTINAGSTADFTVTAANAKTYQWMFQGTNIAGATNAEYKIAATATNQAGVYSVVVGSTGTNLTNSATLNVLQGTILNFQISGFPSGPSNVLVELFDHDKPATVQNFLHYVTSVAYSNMFFDRLIPGFVLQGGGWYASNRTDSIPPPVVGDIYTTYVQDLQVNNPPLPQRVDSEFYAGPKVSNTKGTLAMALPAGNVDGAVNDFFFNLVDNPFLDVFTNGGGPYTVFGRVLSGTNVLQYFNNTNKFSKPSFTKVPTRNIFTNGIYDQVYLAPGATSFTDLPVNYHGTNRPADNNLFFVDFTFPQTNAQPVIDTNPPTAAITFPPANSILTNGISLTVRGTAQDDVGLARTYCLLAPQNGAYGGSPGGANAAGAANWSLFFGVIQPGIYFVEATPQDGAGNLGPVTQQTMIISAVLTNGLGGVSATNVATRGVIGDAVGANLLYGTNYAFGAQPGPGWFFVNWNYGTNVSFNSSLTNKMSTNLVLTANFVSNSVPNGIAFTSPPLGGNATNGTFSIQGAVSGLLTPPVTVTCRLFSSTNQQLAVPARQITVSSNWSFPVTNLALGHYYAVVMAQDASGRGTVVTNDFTAALPMIVLQTGNGRGTITTNFNGQFLVAGRQYSMRAAAAAGSAFDTWFDGTNYFSGPVVSFVMRPGLVLTATFVSNQVPGAAAFTYPKSGASLTNPTFNLAGTVSSNVTHISYQLFYGSNTIAPPAGVPIGPGAGQTRTWSAGLTNLAPGSYTVVATVSDAQGRSALISENFQVLARLLLQISPKGFGTVSSNWSGGYLPVGAACTVLARTNGGYVFASWSNSAGLNGINPLAFVVKTNETISANFAPNYFYNVAGTYNGLFYPADSTTISASNSGYFTMTVTSFGLINNLSLSFPNTNLTSTGLFPLYNPAGYATAGFYWANLNGKPVTNYVSLDLTNGTYSLVGTVANAQFTSHLTAFRAATRLTANSAAVPGTNVFTIPGDPSATNHHPAGDGYGVLTLGANGALTLIGRLADNTSFSQSTQISTNYYLTNGVWPCYASLYGGKGIILGWQTNTSPASFEGQVVAWSKPAGIGPYCTNGFLALTNSFAARYSPPVKGTQYQIVFGGASLSNGLTNTLTFGANGLFTVKSGQAKNLALKLILSSGVLSGSFSPPSGRSTNNLYGAFVSPAQGGSGYFLDTNSQTGWFEIMAAP